MSLTGKQARFVEEYLIDLNASAAVLRAGYKTRRPEAYGYDLLRKPDIRAAIADAQRERSHRTGVTADAVVSELATVAFADLGEFVEWGPDGVTLKPSDSIPLERRRAIVEVSQTQSGVRVKLADKNRALDLLGRHLGIFEQQGGDSTIVIANPRGDIPRD